MKVDVRPAWLPAKFKNTAALAKSYQEAERELSRLREQNKQLEQRLVEAEARGLRGEAATYVLQSASELYRASRATGKPTRYSIRLDSVEPQEFERATGLDYQDLDKQLADIRELEWLEEQDEIAERAHRWALIEARVREEFEKEEARLAEAGSVESQSVEAASVNAEQKEERWTDWLKSRLRRPFSR
jgi:hypothetical protein